jgi:hypothetical protein
MKFDSIATFTSAGFLSLVFSLLFLGIGALGNHIFLQCDFMQKQQVDWSNEAGFTQEEFAWLVIGSFFMPIGLCLHLIFIVQWFKDNRPHRYLKFFIFYSLFGLAIWAIIESYNLAKNVLDCGIFCVGSSTIPEDDEKSTGETFIGLVYFFICLALLAIYLSIIVMLHTQTSQSNVPDNMHLSNVVSINLLILFLYHREEKSLNFLARNVILSIIM